MKKVIEKINQILADWDPIGVGKNIATDEYLGYIPAILKASVSRNELRDCMEDILTNDLGLSYNPNNKDHSDDLEKICDEIIQILT